jgi:hypothetical protein
MRLIVTTVIVIVVCAAGYLTLTGRMTPSITVPVASTGEDHHAAVLAATTIDLRAVTLSAISRANRQIFAAQDSEAVYHTSTAPTGAVSFLAGMDVKKDYTVTIRGSVEALIDMQGFRPERDITFDANGTVRVTLPAITLRATVDPKRSEVTLDRDTCLWVLCAGDRMDVLQGAAAYAPDAMMIAAKERGIIAAAEHEAITFYTGMLSRNGFPVVVIVQGL